MFSNEHLLHQPNLVHLVSTKARVGEGRKYPKIYSGSTWFMYGPRRNSFCKHFTATQGNKTFEYMIL